MVKRVCVVTNFRDTGNYGAIFQAYALNRKINDLGACCETLDFKLNEQNGSKLSRYRKRIKQHDFSGVIEDAKRDLEKIVVSKKIKVRRAALKHFKDSIPHTKAYATAELDNLSDKYDCFICGSDQIWRPTYQGSLVKIYWLGQIKGNAVKASYSASIGLEKLPNSVCEEASKYLEDFDYIAVREEQARQFLSTLCDKDITVTVDPVFLLNREHWDSLSSSLEIRDEYIFVYMIHGSKELLESITGFAKQMRLKIVVFPYMAYRYRSIERDFGDIRVFDASPQDFLAYIKNAKYIFTDSFHATAFTIIFNKEFFVSSANELAMSRINNLVSKCGIQNRIIPSNGLHADDYLSIQVPDWEVVVERMEREAALSLSYLDEVLGIG